MFKRFARLSLALVFVLLSTTLINTSSASNYPLQIKSGGYITKLSAKPVRIISLSPSATEILFALNADNQVLAVDDNSNFPESAPKSQLSGFSPNVEAIVSFKPDLVILQIDSTKALAVRDSLSKLKIPVFMEPAARNLSDTYKEIRLLGKLIEKENQANVLIKKMKKDISKVLKSTKKLSNLKIFHELDNTLYTATSKTFIGKVYKDFGLVNVADAANGADTSGYPQLSAEFLISQNPDYIFLADAQYGETKSSVQTRPGWQTINAVKKGNVFELPADIPSRWGPRVVDFYRFVAKALSTNG
jgi:iron complex transport system substrate-binding protein